MAMLQVSLACFIVSLQAVDHIHKKHTARVKFVCSGTKQLKVTMSMYSLDSLQGVTQAIACSDRLVSSGCLAVDGAQVLAVRPA